MTTVEVLQKTRALLVERGRCRTDFEDTAGRLCLAGAINLAEGRDADNLPAGRSPAFEAIRALTGSLIIWNMDQADDQVVLDTIDRAIAAEENKR